MKHFDKTSRWDTRDEEAAEPADPVGSSRGAPTAEPLASGGGGERIAVERPLPASVAAVQPAEAPCTSFEDMYRRYGRFVRIKLRRPDIDPEVAETLHVEVFLTVDKLVRKDGIPENPRGLLTTVTGHVICNHLRQVDHRPRFVAELDEAELPSGYPDPEQCVGAVERKRLIDVILATLPRDMAMLIEWIDLGELTYADVAGILRRPLSTVKDQHRRARERFKELAERLYEADPGGQR